MKNIRFELEKIKDDVVELKFIINESNILAFNQNGDCRTARWDFKGIVDYFTENLVNIMKEDEFPFDVDGVTAAELDNNVSSLDWDSMSIDEMEENYERQYNWRQKHSWLHAANGAILPDVFFRRVGTNIEISWWTSDLYDGVEFIDDNNCAYVNSNDFSETIKKFIRDYKMLTMR